MPFVRDELQHSYVLSLAVTAAFTMRVRRVDLLVPGGMTIPSTSSANLPSSKSLNTINCSLLTTMKLFGVIVLGRRPGVGTSNPRSSSDAVPTWGFR